MHDHQHANTFRSLLVKRVKVIEEIFETEKKYIACLDTLDKVYWIRSYLFLLLAIWIIVFARV